MFIEIAIIMWTGKHMVVIKQCNAVPMAWPECGEWLHPCFYTTNLSKKGDK